MSRKVFLSFLGAGRYEPVKYHWDFANPEDGQVDRYVQKALLEKLNETGDKIDAAFIFLTAKARQMHWCANGTVDINGTVVPNIGLERELNLLNLRITVEAIDVLHQEPEMMSWEIFENSLQRISDEDELYLDITHAFRFMPMVLMALVNYLKAIRHIRVGGIYYGGYELRKEWQLNEATVVAAPIINLVSISDIQDWASAAHLFNLSGNATTFSSLHVHEIELTKQIQRLSNDIFAIRARKLIAGEEAAKILKSLGDIELPVPYRPITESILQQIEAMRRNEVLNMLYAVEWCIQKRLVPQGYALLSEFLPSYILSRSNEDIYSKLYRDTINGIAQINGSKRTFRFSVEGEKRNQQHRIIDKFLLFPKTQEIFSVIKILIKDFAMIFYMLDLMTNRTRAKIL